MSDYGFKIKIPPTFPSIFTFGYNFISNILSHEMKCYQLAIYYLINQKSFQFFEDIIPDTPF